MKSLRRTQVHEFGKEIRALLASPKGADQELAGIVVQEIELLVGAKSEGKRHSKEERLEGDRLRDVGYLQLYVAGHSVRVYFTVINGQIWMLHLDSNKRRTALSEGTKKSLDDRLRAARTLAEGEKDQ